MPLFSAKTANNVSSLNFFGVKMSWNLALNSDFLRSSFEHFTKKSRAMRPENLCPSMGYVDRGGHLSMNQKMCPRVG